MTDEQIDAIASKAFGYDWELSDIGRYRLIHAILSAAPLDPKARELLERARTFIKPTRAPLAQEIDDYLKGKQ